MRRIHTVTAACLAIALAGCASNEPRPEAPTDELTLGTVQAKIEVGMSGADVVEVLGSPNIVTTDSERREVWVYDKVSTEYTQASKSGYGTLILIGGSSRESSGSTRQRTLTVTIKFDEEQRVRDFAYHYSQF